MLRKFCKDRENKQLFLIKQNRSRLSGKWDRETEEKRKRWARGNRNSNGIKKKRGKNNRLYWLSKWGTPEGIKSTIHCEWNDNRCKKMKLLNYKQ